MGWGQRIADETAAHYDALRDRRIPLPLRIIMVLQFHDQLCNSVIQDDQFKAEVAKMLAIATIEQLGPKGPEDEDGTHDRATP